MGISPRRFDGWEPAQRTKIIRDAEGRVVEMITSTEPEWDETDRGVIYALLDYQADLCPSCGLPMSDYLHTEGKPDPPLSSSYAVCVACVAKERIFMTQDKRDQMIERSGGTVYKTARRWLLLQPPREEVT
jgi:hypothetical protein